MREKNGYLSFTRNTKKLKEEKERLRAEGYPLGRVRELVHSTAKQLELPNDAVLIPAPSTSRTNRIPFELCLAVIEKQQIPIASDLLVTRNIVKAANKGALGKLRDPVTIAATGDLEILRGKTVFVVDDVVTTGETTDAMRETLASKGIFVSGVISMAQSEFYLTRDSDLKRITEKLGDPPLNEELETVLRGRIRHRANYIERIINDANRPQIRSLVVAYAERLGKLDERTRNYLGSAKAMDSRLQSREGR
ncbi:MAG: hypothetical protein WBG95_08280 [Sulfitobacter sp.]